MTARILLISNMYPSADHPDYGVFVQNFSEQMSACGFAVTRVAIEGRGHGLFGKLRKYTDFIRRAVTALNNRNYDLVYVHYIGHSLLPFLLVTKPISTPIVINAHGGDVFTSTIFSAIVQKLVTRIIKKASLVVVPSKHFSKVIVDKFTISERKIFISPSGGVDGQLFRPKDLKCSSALFTLGYVSRVDEGKGWDTLLLAVNLLVRAGIKNIQVLVVGGGAQSEQLNAMVIRHQLSTYVQYVGPVPHHELPHYYHRMDLFVFPTRLEESLGLVGLEALTCGVPVVGSNIGGLRGYITPGINGELFPPGDYEALAVCIKNMLFLDPERFNSYKVNALASSRDYDSSIVAETMFAKLKFTLDDARIARRS